MNDAEKKTQRDLIDACNLLCEFIMDRIPKGWEIELTMGSEDAGVCLRSPHGEYIHSDCEDNNTSSISALCDDAIERAETEDE